MGTLVHLIGFRDPYKEQSSRSADVLVEKVIEHFLLVQLEPNCPKLVLRDYDRLYDINEIFQKDYKSNGSTHSFVVNDNTFNLHGFRLTARTTKHRLVYAADQRAVNSDNLQEYLPNLASRLVDENGNSFFYLGVVQSQYLSEHVTAGRTDFDFSPVEDADAEPDLLAYSTIRRADIRNAALPLIQNDLATIIKSINAVKLERIRSYVHTEAPQYRILLKYASEFIDKLSAQPTRVEIETALHRELYQREARMKQENSRIIREAEKVENYDEYSRRFAEFMEHYNELGASTLAQYIAHRRIILDLLNKAITFPEGERKYPLERVVHQLVYTMRQTSDDTDYPHQNLWIIDERLTFYSLITSDTALNKNAMLATESEKKGATSLFSMRKLYLEMSWLMNTRLTRSLQSSSSDLGEMTTTIPIIQYVRFFG